MLQHDKITTLDCIILVAKQYIYSIRCRDKELGFYNFKKYLYKLIRTEKYLALKLGQDVSFAKNGQQFCLSTSFIHADYIVLIVFALVKIYRKKKE